jgi:ribosomal protein S18 acetylase RimI-like enzyme
MNSHIRFFVKEDIDAIVSLSLLAWEPVFVSFEKILGPKVFPALYPDWRKQQAEGVTTHCMNTERYTTIVAEVDAKVVGFITYELNHESKTGEVVLLAVHPDFQNCGIGTELNNHALKKMQTAGMKMAVVEAGGDDSHAPARRSYEKAGYVGLPIVRYFLTL